MNVCRRNKDIGVGRGQQPNKVWHCRKFSLDIAPLCGAPASIQGPLALGSMWNPFMACGALQDVSLSCRSLSSHECWGFIWHWSSHLSPRDNEETPAGRAVETCAAWRVGYTPTSVFVWMSVCDWNFLGLIREGCLEICSCFWVSSLVKKRSCGFKDFLCSSRRMVGTGRNWMPLAPEIPLWYPTSPDYGKNLL